MSFRVVLPAVFAITLLASIAEGQGTFRYQPGDAVYTATVETKMINEMGGQRQEDEVTQRQRLRVSLRQQAGDTMQIGITLDSASVVSTSSGAGDVRALIGLQVEGHLSPLGEVYSSRLVKGNLGIAGPMVAGELAKLLPRMRGDLRPGLTWTDTTSEAVEMLGIPIKRQTITTSTVEGDTAVAGERAWRVNRTAAVSFTGGGTVQGQSVTLQGSSTGTGRILIARTGRYLGSTTTDSAKTNFNAGAMAFTVEQTQTTTVGLAR